MIVSLQVWDAQIGTVVDRFSLLPSFAGGTCCGATCYANLQWTLTSQGQLKTELSTSTPCVNVTSANVSYISTIHIQCKSNFLTVEFGHGDLRKREVPAVLL